ncbi:MAG: hypothetical protein AMXMBFR75_30770 [Candidatus Hinthialibacteria bacterium]|nr:DUF1080 domain-containing protein [bacterium]MBK7494352.1 DUF1080 domain-containing protein [Candidatus Omnitrophota bacterium]MBV6481147.1 hypothetical protein [bacterium]MCC6732479.1 DUF1080 domain-containing protein [Candidatus Omnitrophota bacterium]
MNTPLITRPVSILHGFGLCLFVSIIFSTASIAGDEGFKPLFNGKDLDGWRTLTVEGNEIPVAQSSFSIKDGNLHCSGKGEDYWIVAPGTYGDVVLRLEYKVADHANSGVFMRVPKPGHPAFLGFEVQIMGDYGEDTSNHSTGSIYDVLSPMRNMSKPSGEWNQYEITNQGTRLVVILNGFKVIDTDFASLTEPVGKFTMPYSEMPKQGWIGVQNHGGEISFRNIEIKELK